MAKEPSTTGEQIISELHEKKQAIKDEQNHDRNLVLKSVGITTVSIAIVEASGVFGYWLGIVSK